MIFVWFFLSLLWFDVHKVVSLSSLSLLSNSHCEGAGLGPVTVPSSNRDSKDSPCQNSTVPQHTIFCSKFYWDDGLPNDDPFLKYVDTLLGPHNMCGDGRYHRASCIVHDVFGSSLTSLGLQVDGRVVVPNVLTRQFWSNLPKSVSSSKWTTPHGKGTMRMYTCGE